MNWSSAIREGCNVWSLADPWMFCNKRFRLRAKFPMPSTRLCPSDHRCCTYWNVCIQLRYPLVIYCLYSSECLRLATGGPDLFLSAPQGGYLHPGDITRHARPDVAGWLRTLLRDANVKCSDIISSTRSSGTRGSSWPHMTFSGCAVTVGTCITEDSQTVIRV